MKVIARPQGTGKTRELLTDAYMNKAQVLTTNKRALQAKAEAYGMPGIVFLDWEDMAFGNYDSTKPLYIHKITDVLQELFNSEFEELKLDEFSVSTEN